MLPLGLHNAFFQEDMPGWTAGLPMPITEYNRKFECGSSFDVEEPQMLAPDYAMGQREQYEI